MTLEYLEIPKNKMKQLEKKNIVDAESFLRYLPKRYSDFRVPKNAKECSDGEEVCMVLRVVRVEERIANSGKRYVSIAGKDQTGHTVYLSFFNAPYVINKISGGTQYAFCGKVKIDVSGVQKYVSMINPMKFSSDIQSILKIRPVYKKIQGMSEDYFLGLLLKTLSLVTQEEYLDNETIMKFGLMRRNEMTSEIHMPSSFENIKKAQERVLFDDLFLYNYFLRKKLSKAEVSKGIAFTSLAVTNQYIHSLKFELTEGQKNAIKEILQESRRKTCLQALVQGDVGCGKTEVAKIAMLMSYDVGYQSILIAPTQVLAEQHANDFKKSFEAFGVPVHYIFGGMKVKEKKVIIQAISTNTPCIIVGTHAVFSKDFNCYGKLGLVIVDEEHKFGVEQRETFQKKTEHIHHISMSATPIPRTLAMSLYGENVLVLSIKTLPKGKKPIQTEHVLSNGESLLKLNSEIKKGHQAYVICPFIEDSENEQFSGVDSVETVYEEYNAYYTKYGIQVGMINGKMKSEDIKATLERFYLGEISVLVSTTMVEVGVNVPNATIILIKNAERFGLAQLHQLRGRVGRGIAQGSCLLQSAMTTDEAKAKIEVLVKTNDGFVIAQKDMEMRGMGDFLGTSQSGDNQLICLMMANPLLNDNIKKEIELIQGDPIRKASVYEKAKRSKIVKTIEKK